MKTDRRGFICVGATLFAAFWNTGQLPIAARAAVIAEYLADIGSVISAPGLRWTAQFTSPAYGNLAFPVEDDLGTGTNAWQISDQSATPTNPLYSTTLTASEAAAAVAAGWRLTSSARYVFDFGDAANFGLAAKVAGRSYELRLDLTSTGNLQATLVDESPRTFVLTSGGTGPLAYHDFALEYNPSSALTSFQFGSQLVDSWDGLPTAAADAVQWGNTEGPNRGIMNYHSVRFETAPFSAVVPGDYERDGDVDANDYAVWRHTFGSTTALGADGNGNSIVDAADYVVWRQNRTEINLLADYNTDGSVNTLDYALWRSTFGSTSALAADGNRNAVVDSADFVLWRKSSLSGIASSHAIAVPEPATRTCLLIVASVTPTRRNRVGSRR